MDVRWQRRWRQHLEAGRLLGVDFTPIGDAGDAAALDEVADAGDASADLRSQSQTRPQTGSRTGSETGSRTPAARSFDQADGRHLESAAASSPAFTDRAPTERSPVGAGDRAGQHAGADSPEPVDPATLYSDPGDDMPLTEKARQLSAMDENEVRVCQACELCKGRNQTVFGEGDPNADLLFIGEGPGANEDLEGRPFVGRAGDLLGKMIVAMGLQRSDVFIANVVKCRPPNNRTPSPAEVAACSGYLHRQISIIRPKAIVTLGAPATQLMLKTKEGITKIRGDWRPYESPIVEGYRVPIMPTFHPAYLLRSYTKENRKRVWSDLQSVMVQLGKVPPGSENRVAE